MKHGKTPNLAQKKFLKARGLAPEEWYIIKDTPELMEAVSKKELNRCRIRKLEGADAKPRTRVMRKEQS